MGNYDRMRKILWQYKGPASGICPCSFCNESYGFISAPLFLQQEGYTQYFSTNTINQNTTHNFYCDSESLLKHMRWALHRFKVNPSQCLSLDLDLESGIINIVATLRISFKYLHVKSYQNDARDDHLLPGAAQMNVHANTLVIEYLDNHATAPSKIVPFIPASQASLTINSETITQQYFLTHNNYTKQLVATCSTWQCNKRLMDRNAWSQHIFRSINWDVPGDVPGKALDTLWRTAPRPS